jgi:hypothetical protein
MVIKMEKNKKGGYMEKNNGTVYYNTQEAILEVRKQGFGDVITRSFKSIQDYADSDIPIESITKSFISDWQSWLVTKEKPLSVTTAKS